MHSTMISLFQDEARNGSQQFLLVLFTTVVFTFTAISIHRLVLHPLSGIPGPALAKVTRLWQSYHYIRGTWHDDVLRLHEKYGAVVRIAPNEVSFVDAEALKKVYSYANASQKTDWYHTWGMAGKSASIFALTDSQEHARRRRQVSQIYTMTSVLSAEPYIQALADQNWEQFRKLATAGEVVDLSFWATAFAYDVVADLGFREPTGFVAKGADPRGLMKSLYVGFFFMANLGWVPYQSWWFRNRLSKALLDVFYPVPNEWPIYIGEVGERVKARRKLQESGRRDFLQHLFETTGTNGQPLSHLDVMSEASNILSAGGDTTAIGITACLVALMEHPESVVKLRKEVDGLFVEKSRHGYEIRYNECLSLPYLQAFIKETMRMHPSIQFQLPREGPLEGLTIDGKFIPPGTHLSMSPRSMNRSKDIFGPDANLWRPERWLEDERKAKYMDSLLCTFGFGSRTCIGKNLATVEINKYLAQFVRQFDVAFFNPERPYSLRTDWFCTPAELLVRLQLRKG